MFFLDGVVGVRLRIIMTLFVATALVGCDPTTAGNGRGTTAPGQGCAETMECQNGLICVEGECVFERCNRAPDPASFCADQLGVSIERAVCELGEGTCALSKGAIGEACVDDDGCTFGSVCHQRVCVETCLSSASCRVDGEVCLVRAEGGGKICQPSPGCGTFPDPIAHCEDELGLPAEEVMCGDDGVCAPVLKEVGESCRFDAQCADSVCEAALCTPLCQEDSECDGAQAICRPRAGEGEQRVCAEATCLDVPDPNGWCEGMFGVGATCGGGGECVTPVVGGSRTFLIRDVSPPESCEHVNATGAEPGADLFAVIGLDYSSDDYYVGAHMIDVIPGSAPFGNDFADPTVLNKALSEEQFSDDGCPSVMDAFASGAVFSMGCGGQIVMELRSLSGGAVSITPDVEIAIGEYTAECSENAGAFDADAVEVYYCEDDAAVITNGDYTSCDTPMYVESDGPIIYAYIAEDEF